MRGMDPCAKGIAIGCLDGVFHSAEESAQKKFWMWCFKIAYSGAFFWRVIINLKGMLLHDLKHVSQMYITFTRNRSPQ